MSIYVDGSIVEFKHFSQDTPPEAQGLKLLLYKLDLSYKMEKNAQEQLIYADKQHGKILAKLLHTEYQLRLAKEKLEQLEHKHKHRVTESSNDRGHTQQQEKTPSDDEGQARLQRYGSLSTPEAIANAMLNDVEARGEGEGEARKYFMRTIIFACHPDRNRGNMAQKALAERVSKIANKINEYFTTSDLWDRPEEWKEHLNHLITQNDI